MSLFANAIRLLLLAALATPAFAAGPRDTQQTFNGPGTTGFRAACSSTFSVTNNLTNSQGAFNGANWNKAASGASAMTVTDNNATAPDGTQTASTINLPAVTATSSYSLLGPTQQYQTNYYASTYDIYLKGANGGEKLYLYSQDSVSGAGYVTTPIVLSNQWARYSVTFVAKKPYLEFGVDLRDANETAASSAQTFYAWGAQLIGFSFETQLIPTTGAAVTKALTIPCPAGTAFRDFSSMSFYAGNPILPQNTGTYNAGGISNPFFSLNAQKNGLYYAFAFCTVAGSTTTRNLYNNLCLNSAPNPAGQWTDVGAANPIITATSGAWDDHYLLHPSMAPFSCSLGKYCMYFSAMNSSNHSSIGVAYANDPSGPWTQYSSNPIIPATGVASTPINYPSLPTVIQIGNQLFMYTAINDNSGTYLAYFTSPLGDGVNWTFQGAALQPPQTSDWDASIQGEIDPFVFKNKNGFYEMVYTAFFGGNNQSLGYAVSLDGKSWWKRQDAPIAKIGTSLYPPTNTTIGDGLFFEQNGNFYMFFNNDDAVSISSGNVTFMADH